MRLLNLIKIAAVALVMAAGSAQAVSVHFDVDGAGSSANANRTGCIFCASDISASTVSGLDSEAFSLTEGMSYSFDFIEFTASGLGGGTYEVSATLAFSDPGGAITATGGGVYGTFFGAISGGTLTWDDAVQQVAFGNGGLYTVALQQGITLVKGSAIAKATVTLDAAPVPLPASALLLLAGIGGLGVMRARNRRLAAAA